MPDPIPPDALLADHPGGQAIPRVALEVLTREAARVALLTPQERMAEALDRDRRPQAEQGVPPTRSGPRRR